MLDMIFAAAFEQAILRVNVIHVSTDEALYEYTDCTSNRYSITPDDPDHSVGVFNCMKEKIYPPFPFYYRTQLKFAGFHVNTLSRYGCDLVSSSFINGNYVVEVECRQ